MSRVRAVWQRVPTPVVDIVLVAVAAVDVHVVNMWEHTRLVRLRLPLRAD